MERMQLSLKRMQHQITLQNAYNQEVRIKREYVAKIKQQFPLIQISEEDIANCNLIELKKRVYLCLENVRMTSSAITIQRAWRR